MIAATRVQVMIAGGSSEYCASAMTPAAAQSLLFDASPGADHTLVVEKTNFPRIVRLAALIKHACMLLHDGLEHLC